ncbi:hypothetical protein CDL60_14415 [Roseateles noduli]|nr:hypothetical protein CDL60_14415 [Roseateles noduli]
MSGLWARALTAMPAAAAAMTLALALGLQLAVSLPAQAATPEMQAQIRVQLLQGRALFDEGRTDEALALFESAVESVAAWGPPEAGWAGLVMRAHGTFCESLAAQGQFQRAVTCGDRWQAAVAALPADADGDDQRLRWLLFRIDLTQSMPDTDEDPGPHLLEAAHLVGRKQGDPYFAYRAWRLAKLMYEVQPAAARAWMQQARQTATTTRDRSEIAFSLGRWALDESRFEDASSLFQEALQGLVELEGQNGHQTMSAKTMLAAAQEQLGQIGAAQATMRDVLAGRIARLGEGNFGVATARSALARYLAGTDPKEAEVLLAQALPMLETRAHLRFNLQEDRLRWAAVSVMSGQESRAAMDFVTDRADSPRRRLAWASAMATLAQGYGAQGRAADAQTARATALRWLDEPPESAEDVVLAAMAAWMLETQGREIGDAGFVNAATAVRQRLMRLGALRWELGPEAFDFQR